MGMFDDLIPGAAATAGGDLGLFEDLVPEANRRQRRAPVADAAIQAVRGFNEGVGELVHLPHTLVKGAYDLTVGAATGTQYPPRYQPVDDYFHQGPQPETDAGRYMHSAGKAVGVNALPAAGFIAKAPAIARSYQAAPPTTAIGRVVQETADQAAAAPGSALAIDMASNASGGVAMQAAQDSGYGPAGQMVAGIVGGMVPGIGLSYATPSRTPIGTPTGRDISQRRLTEAVRDADAFERLEVRPFGPAFNQGPVASVGKQLTETPYVGSPLRNAMDETYEDIARAAERTAEDISPGSTAERAGQALQGGLERYTQTRFHGLDPADVSAIPVPVAPRPPGSTLPVPQAQGLIQPNSPVPRNMVMSQGAMGDEIAAAPIRQQMGLPPMQGANSQTYRVARTTVEDLSDNELRAVINRPAHETSFLTRAEAMYERAYRMLPPLFRTNDTANGNLLAAVNTRHALGAIDNQIANQIAGQGTITGALADRIRNARASNFQFRDLRAIRTEIGRALSSTNPFEATLNRGQLRQLYGAITSDIEIGLETLANRALQRIGQGGMTAEMAQRAVHSVSAFRMADRHFRQGMERIDSFLRILRTDSPEAAVRTLVNAAREGEKGNVQMARAALNALRPAERAQIGARVITAMGEPVPSAGGIVREVGFSPSSFLTRYNAMSDEFRDLLFAAPHRQAIDDLARVAGRMAEVDKLANTSRTGTNSLNITGTVGALASGVTGDVATPLMIGGGGFATSVLMSRPEYVRWMIGYIRLRAQVRAGTDRMIAPLLRHVGNLEVQARANPALWPGYLLVAEEAQREAQRRPR